MKYYYVPSTYRGKRFGSGIRGGAVRGFGCLVKGTLKGGYLKTYAEPPLLTQIEQNPFIPEGRIYPDLSLDPPPDFPEFPEVPHTGEYEERQKKEGKQNIQTENAKNLREKVNEAEESGKPVSIGKRLYNFAQKAVKAYQNLSPTTKALIAVAGVEGTKALLGTSAAQTAMKKVAEYAPQALGAVGSTLKKGYEKVKDYFAPKIDASKEMADFYPNTTSVFSRIKLPVSKPKIDPLPSSAFKKSYANGFREIFMNKTPKEDIMGNSTGWGYGGGRGRFRKGSPEAKAYMARLRAMRKSKRGSGIRGLGFPKGVKPRELRDALRQTINGNRKIVRIRNHELGITRAWQEIKNYIKM